jgi:hypothetical protein
MTNFPYLDDAERWRKRAEEMRSHADAMTEREAKDALLRLALDYDRRAERTERDEIRVSSPETCYDGHNPAPITSRPYLVEVRARAWLGWPAMALHAAIDVEATISECSPNRTCDPTHRPTGSTIPETAKHYNHENASDLLSCVKNVFFEP